MNDAHSANSEQGLTGPSIYPATHYCEGCDRDTIQVYDYEKQGHRCTVCLVYPTGVKGGR